MRMLLFDFSTERTIDAWVPINDVVMGGVSTGRLEATGNDTVAFAGLGRAVSPRNSPNRCRALLPPVSLKANLPCNMQRGQSRLLMYSTNAATSASEMRPW